MRQIAIFIIILGLIIFIIMPCFAGNVVRVKATGETIYRQVPDFEVGLGIVNALQRHPQYQASELEELTLSEGQFKQDIKDLEDKIKKEKKDREDRIKAKLGLSNQDLEDLKNLR